MTTRWNPLAFFLLFSLALGQGAAFGVVGETEVEGVRHEVGEGMKYMPGEVIVKLKEGKTLDDLKELNAQYDVLSAEPVFKEMFDKGKESPPSSLDRIYLLRAAATADVQAMVASYQAHPAVEYAEPNHMVEIQRGTLNEAIR